MFRKNKLWFLKNIKKHNIFELFKIRNFRNFFIGNTISLIGDSIFFTTILWWVYSKSDSALSISYITVADTVPMILFSSILGVVVDRCKRKKMLLTLNFLQTLIMFILTILVYFNKCSILVIIITIFLNSIVAVGKFPLIASIIPSISDANGNLKEMNTLVQFGRQISTILGASLAGLLFDKFGIATCIFIDLISFIIGIYFLSRLDIPDILVLDKENNHFIKQFKDGAKYLLENKKALKLIIIICMIMFFTSSLTIITPVLVKKNFSRGSEIFGLINSLRAIGALSTILIITHIKDSIKFCNISLFLIGATFIFIGGSKVMVITMFLYFILGFFSTIVDVLYTSILQNSIEKEFVGRVFGVLGTLIMTINTLSSLFFGFAIENISILINALVVGISIIILSLVYKKVICSKTSVKATEIST